MYSVEEVEVHRFGFFFQIALILPHFSLSTSERLTALYV